jgi:ferredoxin
MRCREGGRITIGEELEEEKLPGFARKRAASDEAEYAADVAENKDLVYLIENTCIHCNRLMSKSEVKILPPSYIQQRDPNVSAGVVKRRLMCIQCYNALSSGLRQRVKFDRYKNANRVQMVKTALVRLLNGQ